MAKLVRQRSREWRLASPSATRGGQPALGQGAGLVGAGDVDPAQGLDGGQAADQGPLRASRRATAAWPTPASNGRPSGMADRAVVTATVDLCGERMRRRPDPPGRPRRRPCRPPAGRCAGCGPGGCPADFPRSARRSGPPPWLPRRVCRPTATTTARPVPTTTSLPSSTMRSDSLRRSAPWATGSDSPVSAASSTSSLMASISRASAATRSPGPSNRMSPGTRSVTGKVTACRRGRREPCPRPGAAAPPPLADLAFLPDAGGDIQADRQAEQGRVQRLAQDQRQAGAAGQEAGHRAATGCAAPSATASLPADEKPETRRAWPSRRSGRFATC